MHFCIGFPAGHSRQCVPRFSGAYAEVPLGQPFCFSHFTPLVGEILIEYRWPWEVLCTKGSKRSLWESPRG